MCPAHLALVAAAAITGHLEAASRSDKCDSESERLIIAAERKNGADYLIYTTSFN